MLKKIEFIPNLFLMIGLFVIMVDNATLSHARDISSIEIHASSGVSLQVHLLLIDPYGNKTGFDPSTNIDVDQIPDSGHDTEDIPGLLPTAIIGVGRPKSGTYTLNVIGTAPTEYTVELSLSDSSGNVHVVVFKGVTANEVISTYTITYNPTPGITPKVERVVTVEDLKNDVNIAFNLSLIDNEGIKQSLLAKLNAVEKAIEKGNKHTAENQLNAFISEVDAQRDKHIKGHVVDILIEGAVYLINSLQ